MNKSRQAASGFLLRVEQAGRAAEHGRCQWTAPLFPLLLILEADETLAEDARHLLKHGALDNPEKAGA